MLVGNKNSLWGKKGIVDKIISYYRLDGDATDEVGNNDGVETSTVYTTGVNGQGAEFVGIDARKIEIDSQDFSFGDGVTDSPFSISFFVKFNSLSNTWLVSKRATISIIEYQIYMFDNIISIGLYSAGLRDQYMIRRFLLNPIINTWYHITTTYNGSSDENAINVYVNGVNNNGDAITSGAYIAMDNTISKLCFGNPQWRDGLYNLNGVLDGVGIFNYELTPTEVLDNYNLQLTQELA